jgi:hypothetical protein
MLKKSLFTLVCLAVFSCAAADARAQFPVKLDPQNDEASNGCVSNAYRIVFGRSPQPPELVDWRKAGFDDTNCGSAPYVEVIQKLKATLRTPQGANELANTIRRGYEDSFGRKPKTDESDYWTIEIVAKQKNFGYMDIIDAHRLWMKDEKNLAYRTYATYQAYLNGIGRAPFPGDLEYWRNRMKQEGLNYKDCYKANITYITGNSPAQVQERLETIKRAFAVARLPMTAERQSQISVLVVKKKPDFKRLTELINVTFPNVPKIADFPDPPK